jgi:hypothetical protein
MPWRTKGASLLVLVGSLWRLHDTYLNGPSWEFAFFLFLGLPFAILFTVGSFLTSFDISSAGIAGRLAFSSRKRLIIKWDTVKRIMDDSFLFFHSYRILPTDEYRFFSKKPMFVVSNFFSPSPCEFLREAVLRIPPQAIVDQSILDLTGLTAVDIGRLYEPPGKVPGCSATLIRRLFRL